ncbi:hypothetical protein B0H11DRAFT_2183380 [Mycena galericulata]|nr:hypothetical protein B0H11DRAFT_2183380 [Mycena galericulata]
MAHKKQRDMSVTRGVRAGSRNLNAVQHPSTSRRRSERRKCSYVLMGARWKTVIFRGRKIRRPRNTPIEFENHQSRLSLLTSHTVEPEAAPNEGRKNTSSGAKVDDSSQREATRTEKIRRFRERWKEMREFDRPKGGDMLRREGRLGRTCARSQSHENHTTPRLQDRLKNEWRKNAHSNVACQNANMATNLKARAAPDPHSIQAPRQRCSADVSANARTRMRERNRGGSGGYVADAKAQQVKLQDGVAPQTREVGLGWDWGLRKTASAEFDSTPSKDHQRTHQNQPLPSHSGCSLRARADGHQYPSVKESGQDEVYTPRTDAVQALNEGNKGIPAQLTRGMPPQDRREEAM